MCNVREWGGGAAAVSGWSKGRREKDAGRLNPNEGAFGQTESACVSPADGLLSAESWGVGAECSPRAQGGPFFIPYFTSLSILSLGLGYTLFCLLLFGAPNIYLTFINLLTIDAFFFSSFLEGVVHFQCFCLVLCCLRNKLEGRL